MKSFLLRVLYAVVALFVFWLVVPLFLTVVGVPVPAAMMQLVRVVVACLALVYVFFGPTPKAPWEQG